MKVKFPLQEFIKFRIHKSTWLLRSVGTYDLHILFILVRAVVLQVVKILEICLIIHLLTLSQVLSVVVVVYFLVY